MRRPHVTLRPAKWHIRVPTQRDADSLIERICDARTKASRERIQRLRKSTTSGD